ncbi:hypothetical protein PFICI_02272 [Pestalotiopsis fici W106-1]|uniref:Nephrocystin 3-like N-terminal domain-containing protein n=1 Tax=Pestalotiopsis fici (strain W106-1 / CGMCC3.15140) TaxID=1229662 RepID=W3XFR7_PESFW|nr:uncharacterized protein PFICI_02272 [Pestalotiopsis fici W106-1]ETS84247.1 hypothetical protein PFICI_02272 [Pestalotiopsis fici W106-1]
MFRRDQVLEFGQTSTQFHGSGIQNHNGRLHAGRDIIINSATPKADESRDDLHRQEVLRSLRFEQMGSRQQSIKRAHAQTCQWFFETREYKSWLDTNKSQEHGGFLWIKGKPGVGKSTLMKVALDHTSQTFHGGDSCIISFFFNARGNDLERSTTGLYRALLFQLLKARPDSQIVLDTIEGGLQWSIESIKQTFERALKKLDHQQQLICFIDALDECKEQEIRELVSWLDELSCDHPLHACLATRHFPNITIRKGLQINLESRQEHIQDICCYVRDKLYFKDDRRLATRIRVELQTKASGIFMWVVLVIDMLNREYDSGQKHKILEKIRELPYDLHELFRDIFTRGPGPSQGLLLCLQWILFAKYPLTPRQLYLAIISGTEPNYLVRCHSKEISDDDVERYILNASRGLAEITKSWRWTVQFVHESIKDFLVKENGIGTIWADLKTSLEGQSQEALKRCCLQYQTTVYALLRQTVSIALLRRLLPEIVEHRKVISRKYPFLEYANDGVLFHADQAERHKIKQDAFLRQFSTEAWSKLQDVFEVRGARWYWPNVSLLYVLTRKDYSALIRASSLHSCFDVEGGPYGSPVFVALATKNFAALESLLEVFVKRRTFDNMSCRDQIQLVRLDYDKMAKNNFRDFVFSRTRGVVSHLAEFGCSGILEIYFSTSIYLSDPDSKDEDGWTPLSYAARTGDVATVRLLVDRHACVNNRTGKGWMPLHLASLKGHLEAAKLLIDRGAEVDMPTRDGKTPLYWARKKKNLDLEKLLMGHGAVLEQVAIHDGTPPYETVAKDEPPLYGTRPKAPLKFTKTSINDDAKFRNTTTDRSMIIHLSRDQLETIKLILEGAADANTRYNDDGSTILCSVSRYGYTEIAKRLLDRGADINATGNQKKTPLHWSISPYRNLETVRLLLDRGANVNALGDHTETPLHLAAWNMAIVRLLLDRGANVNALGDLAETPLHKAARYGHTETIILLIDRGADVNAKALDGKTVLHDAAESGSMAIVKLLLDRGADADAKSMAGMTPLQLATLKGHRKAMNILRNHDPHTMDSSSNEEVSSDDEISSSDEEVSLPDEEVSSSDEEVSSTNEGVPKVSTSVETENIHGVKRRRLTRDQYAPV